MPSLDTVEIEWKCQGYRRKVVDKIYYKVCRYYSISYMKSKWLSQ